MKDYLEHIRLVHLSMMVVLGTSLYLALAGWTHGNLLEQQIGNLSSDIQQITGRSPEHSLRALIPRWDDEPATLLRVRMQKELGGPIVFSGGNRVARVLNQSPNPHIVDRTTLESIKTQVQVIRWSIQVIDSVMIDWALVQDAVANFFGRRSSFVWPSVEVDVLEWPERSHSCIANVLFEQPSPFIGRNDRDRLPLVIKQEHVKCFAHVDTISTPPNLFLARYPVIVEYWDSIGSLSRQSARSWAKHLTSESLRESNPTLAGLTFEGEYVALVSPILLVALLTYMFALLRHLLGVAQIPDSGSVLQVSPWIGTMGNLWARAVSWVTLVMLPFLCTTILLWNQRHVNFFLSVCIGAAVAILGCACVRAGTKLGHRETGE